MANFYYKESISLTVEARLEDIDHNLSRSSRGTLFLQVEPAKDRDRQLTVPALDISFFAINRVGRRPMDRDLQSLELQLTGCACLRALFSA